MYKKFIYHCKYLISDFQYKSELKTIQLEKLAILSRTEYIKRLYNIFVVKSTKMNLY